MVSFSSHDQWDRWRKPSWYCIANTTAAGCLTPSAINFLHRQGWTYADCRPVAQALTAAINYAVENGNQRDDSKNIVACLWLGGGTVTITVTSQGERLAAPETIRRNIDGGDLEVVAALAGDSLEFSDEGHTIFFAIDRHG